MASAFYDINAQEYSTFDFHVEWYDNDGNAVNLTGYSARFHVRPYTESSTKYLEVTTSGVTSGGSTGSYTGTGGVSGSGRIYLNSGETGGVFTGGIRVTVDSTTMGYIHAGQWKYSLDVTKGVTTDELLNGRFVVAPKASH
jgi:hypothetical protein